MTYPTQGASMSTLPESDRHHVIHFRALLSGCFFMRKRLFHCTFFAPVKHQSPIRPDISRPTASLLDILSAAR